jgi:hypothetical protein
MPRSLLPGLAAAAALLAAGCGDDSAESGDAPRGTGPVDLRIALEGHSEQGDRWTESFEASRGEVVTLRLRIQNRGGRGAPDVRAQIGLPPGLKVDRATVVERPVGDRSLGRPVDVDALLGDGLDLGPMGPVTFTELELSGVVREGARRSLRATAAVGDETDALAVSVAG